MFERAFGAMEALSRLDDAVLARCEALTTEHARLWDANAELRDEIYAANAAVLDIQEQIDALVVRF